jgi:OOP family OmpA-OmpF porin
MNEKTMVGFGAAVLSALIAHGAMAQEPASGNASASGSVSLGGDSGASASGDASASGADDDKKFEPEPMQFELGAILGFMLPSKDHNLRADTTRQFPYTFAPEVGLRASFIPIQFLGVEAEGAWMWTTTEQDNDANLFAARVHVLGQLPMGRLTPFLVVGGGAIGAGSGTMGTDTDPAIHFGLGAKYAFTQALGLRLDLRDTMHQKFNEDQGTLTHSPEVLLSLQFALHLRHERDEAAPAAPADSDHDGFADANDKCPKEPGIAPDGCPDKDTDGDTVMDSKDACPADPGPPASCGCGVKDTDKDGVPDDLDKCPNEPGTINGCPDLDPDHDGINVPADKCPDKPETVNGFDDDDGCPDEIPEKIRKFTGVIKGIEFDTGKDTIRATSEPVLENALLVLNEFPKTRIEISGHTDNQGTRDANLDLSKRRADSVKKWFVGKGVDESRIETRGAGPDEPIADNKTAEGKQKNRRIEFKLVQQAGDKGASPKPAEAKPADASKASEIK